MSQLQFYYNATLTFQTSEGNVVYDLSILVEAQPSSVPKPSTYALGLIGMAGLAFCRLGTESK